MSLKAPQGQKAKTYHFGNSKKIIVHVNCKGRWLVTTQVFSPKLLERSAASYGRLVQQGSAHSCSLDNREDWGGMTYLAGMCAQSPQWTLL